MENKFYKEMKKELELLKKNGRYKKLRFLKSPLSGHAKLEEFDDVIIMCSNNYLGLANKPEIIEAGIKALKKYGTGAASVRFICGTFDIHRKLEERVADFLQTEACLTYMSCMDANMAVIPTLLDEGDGLVSDELNHASIIDGCRLVKKGIEKRIYNHRDLSSLEKKLKELKGCKNILVVTDGVFSMEGDIAPLSGIIKLTKRYEALIMVDDSHGIGVLGKTGRGTIEYYDLMGKIDIITGTFGKALGGAGGGFVAAKKEIRDMLIQNSRFSLFSNSIPPVLAAIGIASIDYLESDPELVVSLRKKIKHLRNKLKENNIKPLEGESAIIPIIVGETSIAIKIAQEMLQNEVYVTGFGFPVVPEGEARIRLQVSDALSYEDIDKAVDKISKVFSVLSVKGKIPN